MNVLGATERTPVHTSVNRCPYRGGTLALSAFLPAGDREHSGAFARDPPNRARNVFFLLHVVVVVSHRCKFLSSQHPVIPRSSFEHDRFARTRRWLRRASSIAARCALPSSLSFSLLVTPSLCASLLLPLTIRNVTIGAARKPPLPPAKVELMNGTRESERRAACTRVNC